jgi:hypothetical protein
MHKPSPAMLVALLALFVALGGAGIAATGGNFILGQQNAADATTDLQGAVGAPQFRVTNSNASGTAIRGRHTATTGAPPGVQGDTASTSAGATGVYGLVSSASSAGDSNGVEGWNSGSGRGVYGKSSTGYGVYGNGKFGVVGTGTDTGVYATSANASGSGVYGQSSSSGNGVFGKSSTGYGVRGDGNFGVVGFGGDTGVWASSVNPAGSGVYGQNTGSGKGVYGKSTSGNGVYGESTYQAGVYGHSNSFDGVYGDSNSATSAGVSGHGGRFGLWGRGDIGLHAETSTGGAAVDAIGDARQNLAGNGWVKAMAYVNPFANDHVEQCYNSQLPASQATAGNCGISATSSSVGTWDISFGFDTTNRFAIVTSQPSADLCGSNCGILANVTLTSGAEVQLRYARTDVPTNETFFIVIL